MFQYEHPQVFFESCDNMLNWVRDHKDEQRMNAFANILSMFRFFQETPKNYDRNLSFDLGSLDNMHSSPEITLQFRVSDKHASTMAARLAYMNQNNVLFEANTSSITFDSVKGYREFEGTLCFYKPKNVKDLEADERVNVYHLVEALVQLNVRSRDGEFLRAATDYWKPMQEQVDAERNLKYPPHHEFSFEDQFLHSVWGQYVEYLGKIITARR